MSQTSTQPPAIADGTNFFSVEQWAPSHGYHDSMASLLNYIQTKQLSPTKSVRQAAPQPLQRQRHASKPKTTSQKQPSRSRLLTTSKPPHRPSRPKANTSCRRTSMTVVNRPRILDKPEIQALRHDLNHTRCHGITTSTTTNTTTSLMAARDLHAAIESRDLGTVYAMLRSGVDPNLSRGGVIVTSASGRPSTPTPRRPTAAAAATSTTGVVGVTPLHRAFSVGCLEAAMFLVLAGADLEASNAAGETAVVRAVRCEFSDDFVALCCELGAVVDAADRSGRSALHYAAGLVHPDVSCRTVLALAAHGADLDARDAEGRAEVVLQLVRRGADVEAALPGGATPLHLAVLRRNAQIVRLLCEHGVDVNGRGGVGGSGGGSGGDSKGPTPKTPLVYAIETGCTEIVRILLKHGADVNMRSNSSGNETDGSATVRNPSNSSTASKGGTSTPTNRPKPASQAGSFPLLAAARLGNATVVDLLLAQAADLGLADADGQTALHAAAAHNHMAVVKRLVAAGAAVGALRADGATPLLLAVRAGHEAVARYLLLGPVPAPAESPADEVDASCAPGPTALWHAVDRGHHEMAKLLIVDRGADPLRVVDAWGSTPLHHAAKKGLDGLVELVLDRMAEGHGGGGEKPRVVAFDAEVCVDGSRRGDSTPSSGNETKVKEVKSSMGQQKPTSRPKQERNSRIWDIGDAKKTTKASTAAEEPVKPNPITSTTTTTEAQTSKLYASLLLAAAEGGNLSTLKLVLARRGPAFALTDLQSAQNAIGDGILAVATAHPEVLRFLLSFKTPDDGAVTGASGSSSIWAAILGRPRRPLLDVNHGNRHGATALHYAALRGHIEGARVLLQKGARQSVVTVEIYDGGLDDYADKRDYKQGTPAGLARQKGFDTLAVMVDKWR
ncbi:uncharacterized protein PgNI_09611 [Pyricularia grisea]|uniref:Ankyrin repeat protein n=1 Tax=Pyricularia grisea TaxID=148305 RepID=A0A6P8AT92_PYRGI|nr:uncharacterized protein PgNI_09611 [Pyricularia grisea]TLD05328.1 hypothetical protein PgNI_09611 [Pyricularia grisea]